MKIKELKELNYTKKEIRAYKVLRFFVSKDDKELNKILLALSMIDIRFQFKNLNKICKLFVGEDDINVNKKDY